MTPPTVRTRVWPHEPQQVAARRPRRQVSANDLSDQVIRSALRGRVRRKHLRARGSVLLEELGLCRGFARVDLAVVNGQLHGYEIKSDRDSLRRLPAQVEAFSKIFDRLTLVVGERHYADATKRVPKWWGILRVSGDATRPRFNLVRRPKDNPSRDPRALVELLWASDALALLETRGAAHGVRGKPRHCLWERIVRELELAEIASAVRRQLKARPARPAHQ